MAKAFKTAAEHMCFSFRDWECVPARTAGEIPRLVCLFV